MLDEARGRAVPRRHMAPSFLSTTGPNAASSLLYTPGGVGSDPPGRRASRDPVRHTTSSSSVVSRT